MLYPDRDVILTNLVDRPQASDLSQTGDKQYVILDGENITLNVFVIFIYNLFLSFVDSGT